MSKYFDQGYHDTLEKLGLELVAQEPTAPTPVVPQMGPGATAPPALGKGKGRGQSVPYKMPRLTGGAAPALKGRRGGFAPPTTGPTAAPGRR